MSDHDSPVTPAMSNAVAVRILNAVARQVRFDRETHATMSSVGWDYGGAYGDPDIGHELLHLVHDCFGIPQENWPRELCDIHDGDERARIVEENGYYCRDGVDFYWDERVVENTAVPLHVSIPSYLDFLRRVASGDPDAWPEGWD